MNLIKFFSLMGVICMLCSCSPDVKTYAGKTPVMKFDEFFNGPLTGHAIIQDRSGKVIRSFVVKMEGNWEGDKGTLKEYFVYDDGKTQNRTWNIKKLSDNRFVGTAADIIGDAPGESAGNAIKWNYVMTVDVSGRKINLSFDDWMYLMTDDLIINRSTMKKFGIKVGEITISIQKDK